MTTCAQRASLLALIEQAWRSGARLRVACDLVGLHVRTLERWRRAPRQCWATGAQLASGA